MASQHSSVRAGFVTTLVRDARDLLVSMKLTLLLLGFSMVLVFAATLDQVELGIWAVQEKYFRSFVVYTRMGPFSVPAFPGGYAVGGMLLLNLVAAHVYRFALSWKKAGIQLVHAGLIVLLVGELLSGRWQEDSHLRLNEGETKNYAESFRAHELVVTDTSDAAFDHVVAVPERRLAEKKPIQHPALPFRLQATTYYPNASLISRPVDAAAPGDPLTRGVGGHVTAVPQAITYRPDERNLPAAIVEFVGASGAIGTWLVSSELAMPQEFEYENRTWRIALRVRRTYYPFSVKLLKFSHDRYEGTDIPRNFSSRLQVTTPDGREDREVLVFMNNPLRFGGLTFYQAGFQNDDRTTILQVVRNPAWTMPYVACALITLGMILQFGFHLLKFMRKRFAPATLQQSPAAGARRDSKPGMPQVV